MSLQRTIGFDFGTHQTKICIEEKEGANISYHFFPFADTKGKESFLLPSVVRINPNNTLSYGFIDDQSGEIVRYFKQATYCTGEFSWKNPIKAEFFSIWYIAYIFFQLEQVYGTDFATNLGVPTDTASLDKNKAKAVCIVLSAIHLVEDVFKNDIETFLKCTIEELLEKTDIPDFSIEAKNEYSLLVFPEAYACLRPLTARSKIPRGMSLMVDIGGGTTDISFFTIEKGNAQIYRFISIAKGLNFLNGIDGDKGKVIDPITIKDSSLDYDRRILYQNSVRKQVEALNSQLYYEFAKACKLPKERLEEALKNRPIIYAGGGSTFPSLCRKYVNFAGVNNVTVADWNIRCFPEFEQMGLCPILNTAYGLSISTGALDDNIAITPFTTIFDGLRDIPVVTKPKAPKINPRDGTVDTYDAEEAAISKPVKSKLFHFVSGRTMNKKYFSALDLSVSDNIERVNSGTLHFGSQPVYQSPHMSYKGKIKVKPTKDVCYDQEEEPFVSDNGRKVINAFMAEFEKRWMIISEDIATRWLNKVKEIDRDYFRRRIDKHNEKMRSMSKETREAYRTRLQMMSGAPNRSKKSKKKQKQKTQQQQHQTQASNISKQMQRMEQQLARLDNQLLQLVKTTGETVIAPNGMKISKLK